MARISILTTAYSAQVRFPSLSISNSLKAYSVKHCVVSQCALFSSYKYDMIKSTKIHRQNLKNYVLPHKPQFHAKLVRQPHLSHRPRMLPSLPGTDPNQQLVHPDPPNL